MPSHNDPLTETGIVADLRKRAFRHGGAIAAIQIPQPAKDTFNVTSNGVSPTLKLTALPYNGTLGSSVYLKWNISPLHEGDDYTVDYSTGIITLASSIVSALKATPTPADRIFVEYWTTGDLIAQSQPQDTGGGTYATSASASGGPVNVGSISITCPTVVAGDLIMFWPSVAVGSGTTTITGPAGFTAQVASTEAAPDVGHDNGVAAGLWTKVATGSEGGTSITATFSTANRATAVLLIYSGGTVTTVSASHTTSAGVNSYTAPTPAAASGKTCVYFFAKSANNTGAITVGSPATQRVASADTGYDATAAGEAVATGTTAPSVSASVPGPGTPPPNWVAATVVLN